MAKNGLPQNVVDPPLEDTKIITKSLNSTFATTVRWLTRGMDASLSACQLGITMASLSLGWIGEPAIAHLLRPLLLAAGIVSEIWIHECRPFGVPGQTHHRAEIRQKPSRSKGMIFSLPVCNSEGPNEHMTWKFRMDEGVCWTINFIEIIEFM